MTQLIFLDDSRARAFEPFSLTRPVCELRAGALIIRERWEIALGLKAGGFAAGPHLRNFDEPWAVPAVDGPVKKGTVVVNSRFAPALTASRAADIWRNDGQVCAVTLDRDVEADEFASLQLDSLARSGAREMELQGRWIEEIWDFVGLLSDMLDEDVPALGAAMGERGTARKADVGKHPVFVEEGAIIEPYAFCDTTAGPIMLRKGATVAAFTRVVGPCYVGPDSQLLGEKISGCSIGEVCKVHGEMSTTIMLGHANKGHDGFVGHSYLGRWSNLGAGTITSNLKNTYGTVALWTPQGERDTGLQFLGTLFGDHAKTGIGTALTTGTVLGAGANVFGAKMPPKAVPPFAWGDGAPFGTYREDKFIEVARRVMARRHVDLSESQARQFSDAFKARWSVEDR